MKISNPNDALSTSYHIRNVHIPSRFFLAPINTGFCRDGVPKSGLRSFHAQRSGRRIGVSYVGNVAVHPDLALSLTTGDLRHRASWGVIADSLRENGSVGGIQIAAKVTKRRSSLKWRNLHSKRDLACDQKEISELSTDAVRTIVRQFIDAAIVAYECGFAIVQIHAAHGYFLSQLLCPHINRRTDMYGTNPTSALCEIIEGIRSLNQRVLIDVRFSMRNGIDSFDTELEKTAEAVERVIASGVDIISLSNGMYDVDRFDIYPTVRRGHACYLSDALRLAAKHQGVLWNIAGNVWDLRALAADLDAHMSVSIGRSLIANPNFIQQSLDQSGVVSGCERCGHCHYYSRSRPHIECGVNAQVGEGDDRLSDL